MNLKVQINDITHNAIINSGFPGKGQKLTFHAFSDEMKARVLENIAQGRKYEVSVTNEEPKIGEWFE